MKVAKIVFLIFLFLIVSCDKNKDDLYPDPDEMNVSDGDTVVVDEDNYKGDLGDPCKFSSDCLSHLRCVDGFCIEDIVDEDTDKTTPDEVDMDEADEDVDDVDDVPDPDFPDENDDDMIDDDPDPDTDIPLGVCGNGRTEIGEECDNGDFNSDEPGKIGVTCRTDCTYARCGDGIVDSPYEICDDGNSEDGDYCSADCKSILGSCGDGRVQGNEVCDKAAFGAGIGEYCSDDCLSIVGSCGDGIRQSHEKCDNAEFGEGIGPHYCSSDCQKVIGSCGDGVLQDNENCDDGDNNGRYGFCAADCSGPGRRCGDGVRDIGYEQCDDGNNEDGDYCSADCQTILGRCGDGVVQANEQCDNAIFGDGTGAYCSDDCQTILGECGDEIVQDNEQCDWGAANGSPYCEYGVEESCSTCNSVCNFAPGQPTFCGDGKIDVQNGEKCDNAESGVGAGQGIGAYCSFDCKTVTGSCGDGAVQSNEACDKATFYDGIGPEYCADDCKSIIGFCGDGTLQATMEECDAGVNNTDSCDYGETSCTVCSTQCKNINGAVSYCGDGKTDPTNEFCDSGADNGKYKSQKPGYCNVDCQGIGAGGYCGDGNLQSAYEQCDNGEENGASECEYGTETCTVCTSSCETAPATGKYCGDGIITDGEKCDDGGNNGTYGFCKSDCTGMGAGCGNGVIEGSEVCDDGTNNGLYGYCNATCTAIKKCGDGIRQPEEVCDSGVNNGVYRLNAPGNCNLDCQGVGAAGYCGNGVVEVGNEQCDHGGLITPDCEYGETECIVCNSECKEQAGKVSYCGDGIVQVSEGETCDDGVNNGNYGYCASDCKSMEAFCGDGIVNGTEDCDHGENNGLYGYCKSDCSGMGSYCGDGIQNGGEICDDGADNGKYGFCKTDCTGLGERCGDGITQSGEGEACDDGVDNGTYGYCNSDCTAMGPYCGDGIQNGGETCDDGADNGTYGHCNATCTAMGPHCGDGVKTDGEFCDDGENNGTYGYCNSTCTAMGPYCGDGEVTDGETCDDGSQNGEYNKCNETCDGPGPHCGDGLRQTSEVCDDGENNGTYDHCAADCSGPGLRCGDGEINGPEVCDDGFLNGNEGYCKEDCTGPFEYCGDGIINGTETCDDGENNGVEGFCKEDCSGPVEYCGDGIENGIEQCDLGEDNGVLTCAYGEVSCKVCTTNCIEQDGLLSSCGDGRVDGPGGDGLTTGPEVCDDGVNNGVYNPYGAGYCSSDCMGYGDGGYCGDGIVQVLYEECDEGVENGDYGICDYKCDFNPHCGDGNLDPGEFCDTTDVQCSDFNQFSSGIVSCPLDCSIPDLSSCVEDPAYASPFFTTSQTDCYDNTSIMTTCPDPGFPFYGQEPQFDYQTQSLTVNTDTILENVSGLMWQKETPSTFSGCTQGGPSGSECGVFEGWAYCEGLSFDGYEDWRLPGAFELHNIMNYFKTAPLILDDFTGSLSENYISVGYYDYSVSMNDGVTTQAGKDLTGRVKCVRGEFQFENSEIISKDALYVNVLDSNKVVFWQYDDTQTSVTWENALNYCENITENGISGFRLPNVNEMQWFVFESLYSDPKVADTGTFWTSTTFNADPTTAYTVDFSNGNVSYTDKTGAAFVMCVK